MKPGSGGRTALLSGCVPEREQEGAIAAAPQRRHDILPANREEKCRTSGKRLFAVAFDVLLRNRFGDRVVVRYRFVVGNGALVRYGIVVGNRLRRNLVFIEYRHCLLQYAGHTCMRPAFMTTALIAIRLSCSLSWMRSSSA